MSETLRLYFQLGFEHILPLGFDHVLFITALFLPQPRLRPVLVQASVFTLAHSVTLALAATGIIPISSSLVEPLIALSILWLAAENFLTGRLRPQRLLLIFVFGLLHGLGFAGVLSDLGLPEGEFFPALIAFNLGVESGQVAVIVALWLGVRWFRDKDWYHSRIVIPASLLIGAVALWWTVERVFL